MFSEYASTRLIYTAIRLAFFTRNGVRIRNLKNSYVDKRGFDKISF